MKNTILGAGGSIGNALTFELLNNNEEVRLVSRSNYSTHGTESFKADLTVYNETLDSVKNSEIVYLCAGLPYDSAVWTAMWPKVMQNTIDACKNVGAKLIFFDNVYMYGKVTGKMIETTPFNPCSRKGEVRAKIATRLLDEIQQKNINATIARAADLYGPYATVNSTPYILIIDKLMHGKSAQWLAAVNKTHSFTNTIDCANGLSLLAKSDESFNQTWHLPTHNPAVDLKTLIELIAKELKVEPNYSVLKTWMIKMGGFFNKTIYESYEMLYQNEFDYHFDSSKFNSFFHYTPKTYQEGIHETIEFIKKK